MAANDSEIDESRVATCLCASTKYRIFAVVEAIASRSRLSSWIAFARTAVSDG